MSMPRTSGFGFALASLWFRLTSLGIIGLVFAEALLLGSGRVQGWTFYLTTGEVVFEVVVRLIFAALAGMALGTICTAALTFFLWYFDSSRQRLTEWATKVGVVLVVFLNSRFALTTLIKWSNRGVRFTSALLVAHFVIFVLALLIPRTRREVVSSLDLGDKMSRRTALATVGGAAALAATEFALGKVGHAAKTVLASPRPKSNILLITFDALSAEDMSLYGRGLPTTPNIDAFAGKSTVFTNFYSASTFTTPSVAALLTGLYPSENHVYQLQGRLRANNVSRTLPHLMRAGGYTTASFVSNPFPYYFAKSLDDGFDVLPEPQFRQGGQQYLWAATAPLHQDSGIGSRVDEYLDIESLWNLPHQLPNNQSLRFRPGASFENARLVLAKLPDGFFLWVHVLAPHDPYIPDSADQGRFLPQAELQSFEKDGRRYQPHYDPEQQSLIDRRRLAYDEYVASADRTFGAFISELENGGKIHDTTVIVSADHGESFVGGVYRHETPYLTRPVIHIPLVIRTPGQQDRRTIHVTADQTALAPTILEFGGQQKPDWMRGQSLAPWLNRDGQGQGEGLAFTQYLEKNSVFRPLHHGSVGVIDGRSGYEYVLDLDTQKGSLRPLDQAHIWNLDRTADNPALAQALRAAIYSRFPELLQKP